MLRFLGRARSRNVQGVATLLTASVAALSMSVASCGDSGTTSTSTTTTSGSTSGSTSSSTGSGIGGSGTALKVLDWNCHNFFDDKNNSAAPDETVVTTKEYQDHVAIVAKVIKSLDPDVAILQEIENQEVLDALNTALGNAYPERRLIDGNDPRGVDIGALSKVPFSDVVSHKDDSFVVEGSPAPTYQFARDAVEYHFTYADRKIVLIGVHLRSKGPPDDPNKRLAEAERARAIANSITMTDPSTGIVILGDFNDLPNSDPLTAVKGKASDPYVDSASLVVPATDQWTFNFMGSAKELIDHQMANGIMNGFVDPATSTIPHTQDVMDASDHAPILITYMVK